MRRGFELLKVNERNMNARTISENFTRIAERLGLNRLALSDNETPELQRLALLIGGEYLEGTVANSPATDASGDTRFAHSLGRVPVAVILSFALDSDAGADVRGLGVGRIHPTGNFSRWTNQFVFVRAANTTGKYGFVVI